MLDDRLRITGRQSHASTPHTSIDPILQAAHTITRLQPLISRETNPLDFGVITVSAIHAGDAENIIPSHADLKLNVRAASEETRSRLLAGIRRVVEAEAQASGNPDVPVLEEISRFPLLWNDGECTGVLEEAFEGYFGGKYRRDGERLQGSEDFGVLATSVGREYPAFLGSRWILSGCVVLIVLIGPSVFFLYGGTSQEVWDEKEREGKLSEVPGNHSPFFAPEVETTLPVGVDSYVVGALAFLGVQS